MRISGWSSDVCSFRSCNGKRCFDEILLSGLQARLVPDGRDRIVVLHMLGNHGPAYYQRYPPAFRRFTPTCDTEQLGHCSRREIVNSYDNAVLYADHVIARTIDLLKEQPGYDTALVYVSDHGESLGEDSLYLHGVPRAIAPSKQTQVPMVMWFSPGFARQQGLDLDCVRHVAGEPASHDHLFPTILGMFRLRTGVSAPALDLLRHCAYARRRRDRRTGLGNHFDTSDSGHGEGEGNEPPTGRVV